jgi:hypothetical protein
MRAEKMVQDQDTVFNSDDWVFRTCVV